jgi:hypothetical protein
VKQPARAGVSLNNKAQLARKIFRCVWGIFMLVVAGLAPVFGRGSCAIRSGARGATPRLASIVPCKVCFS